MATKPYQPRSEALREVRRRISKASWLERVQDARRRERIVEQVLKRVARGESQNAAIRAVVERSKRSATLRDLSHYATQGFEGLIDRRTPRDPQIAACVRDAVEVARMANPSISIEEVEAILETKFQEVPSRTSVKRIWKTAGLARRVGRPTYEVPIEEVEIEELGAAGFQLVQAAEAECGAIEQLVDAVTEAAEELPEPGPAATANHRLRNKKGQLTARYNRSQRKSCGELIGPVHRTAAEKAEERDLGRLSFRTQGRETIKRKLWALVSLPAVAPLSGRIEDLRGPQGRLLEEMCGYEYQSETLRKVVSEFTAAGLGPLLQQTQAATWHDVSTKRWEKDYRAHVVYIDNNVKPLWTGFFTKSAKVSSTGRVQPALTSTFVNTGVGVPIHFETSSGSAPLAPRVLELLRQIEEEHGQPVGRLTVIDGECCSAPLLAEFKNEGRDLIVPLASNMIRPERFRFGRGSAFQPYRDGDRIREGAITLKSGEFSVEARALVIERRLKETWTVLVTLADAAEWSARVLADAYFGRWPNQEGFFRRANQALGVKRVHGYGKRIVANTAVLTELEKLGPRLQRAKSKQAQETKQLQKVGETLTELRKQSRAVERYRKKREERVDEGLANGSTHTRQFMVASEELRKASEEERRLLGKENSLEKKQADLTSKTTRRQNRIEKWEREANKLQSRTEIVEADVAQDTLFTALKLTLGMLVHFIAIEYFPHRPIEWATFLSRIALLPGRRESSVDTVTVFIYGNRRDMKLMESLAKACLRINKRKLVHNGRLLRYEIEWPEGNPNNWSE